jgi:hypothetical protein
MVLLRNQEYYSTTATHQ